jgi:hypothetical protein
MSTCLGREWRKSTRSTNGECVEARHAGDAVEIRDTKSRERLTLAVPDRAWQRFVAAAKGGAFDLQ